MDRIQVNTKNCRSSCKLLHFMHTRRFSEQSHFRWNTDNIDIFQPPVTSNYMVRPGQPPKLVDVISELGIFGYVIGWDIFEIVLFCYSKKYLISNRHNTLIVTTTFYNDAIFFRNKEKIITNKQVMTWFIFLRTSAQERIEIMKFQMKKKEK